MVGGGHVVLPLLQNEVVPRGWVHNADFLARYGLAQAVPGPLFTLAAYLGAVVGHWLNGIVGASIALVAIFFPVAALLERVPVATNRASSNARRQRGSCGVLSPALYNPVWTSGILARRLFHRACWVSVAYGPETTKLECR